MLKMHRSTASILAQKDYLMATHDKSEQKLCWYLCHHHRHQNLKLSRKFRQFSRL